MLNRMKLSIVVAALLFTTQLFAQSAATVITVIDGYVREMIPGQNVTAAYFVLQNQDNKPHTLTKLKSSVAEKVEMHQTVEKDNMMHMEPVAAITIKPKEEVKLVPGGLHIMLIGIDKTLVPGDLVPLALSFDDGSEIALNLMVKKLD